MELKKVLGATQLWAIAVGLVISGEYFGWNYGWGVAGTIGMLLATLVVTVLYLCFVFSFTELTASIPNAGGPFTYAQKAFGPLAAAIAGYATLLEYVLATPAIAFALGSYLHFLYPPITVVPAAIVSYCLFSTINFIGIKESASFTLIVTLLAVGELLVFMGIVVPSFKMSNFVHNGMPFGYAGVFAAIPFAIWFYLAIEGVATVVEETKDPAKNIPNGYILGIGTLCLLALGVMIITGGIGDWQQLSTIDYPLPEAISLVLGKNNVLTTFFAGIGLFGIVASFNSIITSYSRQIFALARENYLPTPLAIIHPRFKTPHWALLFGGCIGIIAILSGKTNELIILSALGALVMYVISMLSLFALRQKHPNLYRPFKVPAYPFVPALALVLSIISLFAIVYYNVLLSGIFFGVLLMMITVYFVQQKVIAHS